MDDSLITPDGLARIENELAELVGARRGEVEDRLRQAIRTDANVVENADHDEALRDLAALERRIALLRDRIHSAKVVEPDASNPAVEVGERVRVRDLASGETAEYDLVGALEACPYAGRVSVLSPLGQALLGRRLGDTAVVEAPRGRLRYEILWRGPRVPSPLEEAHPGVEATPRDAAPARPA